MHASDFFFLQNCISKKHKIFVFIYLLINSQSLIDHLLWTT